MFFTERAIAAISLSPLCPSRPLVAGLEVLPGILDLSVAVALRDPALRLLDVRGGAFVHALTGLAYLLVGYHPFFRAYRPLSRCALGP